MDEDIENFLAFLDSLQGMTAVGSRDDIAKEIIKYDEKLWPVLVMMANLSVVR